ncbi:SDR family NAD(P)-dependent oxidoreductase [Paenibacillus mucilaginosus]|uniref:Short-chain dehydrogenase/reductase SDR n=1 Tax=Paenibacillus mucilaginosus 3016 TaxID=1116391 RepID=H6NGZ3_9BACL|nr:SDR family NAD(P)-dependent oxidoreductase [Paenibacillus mucilaginosus]AFC28435.1 short-chain dehydrogenase/reductase SDR [Paenibacillus mucilaginosus 3016]MCG7218129.1 SDR family NAD(P)-dependent oxidoreductase [Paenibacillus mucilaginosus]WDM29000.1 SDR family NAD(P)-dependent oxidoreductase [Paenibacillus mucilaginosus]WFA17231.1 SDR family NAD(P)-dependent oxidoreductase [Paenibacillus mucilaginosus]
MSHKPLLVIVGSGPGVSASIAKKFGSNGFRVILISRTESSLQRSLESLRQLQIESHGITADASDPDSLKTAFKQIKDSFGTTDVLVYNAAHIVPGDPLSLTEQQLIEDFKVNTVGALTSAQQVIPDMVERKQGTLFFTGGSIALNPNPLYTSLSIGKAATRSLALSIAETVSPFGIYVGQVLIADHVKKGTYYDPDRIADVHWELYNKKDQREYLFRE